MRNNLKTYVAGLAFMFAAASSYLAFSPTTVFAQSKPAAKTESSLTLSDMEKKYLEFGAFPSYHSSSRVHKIMEKYPKSFSPGIKKYWKFHSTNSRPGSTIDDKVNSTTKPRDDIGSKTKVITFNKFPPTSSYSNSKRNPDLRVNKSGGSNGGGGNRLQTYGDGEPPVPEMPLRPPDGRFGWVNNGTSWKHYKTYKIDIDSNSFGTYSPMDGKPLTQAGIESLKRLSKHGPGYSEQCPLSRASIEQGDRVMEEYLRNNPVSKGKRGRFIKDKNGEKIIVYDQPVRR